MILTALVTGAVAALAFGLPFEQGLLIGAVLSPTDPAILIPLFVGLAAAPARRADGDRRVGVQRPDRRGARARGRGRAAERRAAASAARRRSSSVELAISSVVGVLAGVLLSATISSRRTGILRDSAPIAVLAVVAVSYVSLDFAGGSGYLGAFLAGLIVGNMELLGLAMHTHHEDELRIVVAHARRGRDDLRLPRRRREPAVRRRSPTTGRRRSRWWRCCCSSRARSPCSPARCPTGARAGRARELAFLCWTRETGVVPAALVGVLAGLGVPNVELLAGVVALAIVATLLLQATPAPWLARRLGLLEPAYAPG